MTTGQYYQIEGYVKSDVGLVRQNNEDNFLMGRLINQTSALRWEASFAEQAAGAWNCFGVFDGIGGAEHGELASLFSAQVFREKGERLRACGSYSEVEQLMREAFLEANNRIVSARKSVPVCGTTGTVLVTDGIAARIFHVGDSRAFLFREGNLYRLTEDHTTAQLKLEIGIYHSLKEAAVRELHQLTEYIGRDSTQENFVPQESEWIDFRDQDIFLLSSDGLHDFCENEDMRRMLSEKKTVKEMADGLFSIAMQRGGEDNITAALVRKRWMAGGWF